jgi:hypothetical protein
MVVTVTAQGTFSTHEQPVWRERSNFIINAALPEQERFEQLWCNQLTDDRFEVCCIPFFLYDVALGDVVRTAPACGRTYVFREVLEPSGRFVFRVWFGDSFHPRDDVAAELQARGALLEWSSRNLLAVDARDAALAQQIAVYLQEKEDAGQLAYETGKTA